MESASQQHDDKIEAGAKSVRDWVPRIVKEIVEGFDPRRVIFFGSVAHGEDSEENDVDPMVVFAKVEPGGRRGCRRG